MGFQTLDCKKHYHRAVLGKWGVETVIRDISSPREIGLAELSYACTGGAGWKYNDGAHSLLPVRTSKQMPYADWSNLCPTNGNMKGSSEQRSDLSPSTMTHPSCPLWQLLSFYPSQQRINGYKSRLKHWNRAI